MVDELAAGLRDRREGTVSGHKDLPGGDRLLLILMWGQFEAGRWLLTQARTRTESPAQLTFDGIAAAQGGDPRGAFDEVVHVDLPVEDLDWVVHQVEAVSAQSR